jgi:hypothetical protein
MDKPSKPIHGPAKPIHNPPPPQLVWALVHAATPEEEEATASPPHGSAPRPPEPCCPRRAVRDLEGGAPPPEGPASELEGAAVGRVCADELLEAERDEAGEEEAGEGKHVDMGSPLAARLTPPLAPRTAHIARPLASHGSPRATADALCRHGLLAQLTPCHHRSLVPLAPRPLPRLNLSGSG